MKKVVFFAAAAAMLILSSCSRSVWTATKAPVQNEVKSRTLTDLEIGRKVTFRYNTSIADRNGGEINCINAAVAAMCKENKADVIVAPEYHYDSNLKYIEVTGRPAYYTNFRADSNTNNY